MALHDFKGPVNNDKTAIFIKTTGVTATANLVKTVGEAADADAKWAAVKTWAGADDASVIRLPAAITEMPDFHAPPNRQNIEVFDGDGQTVQVLGIGTTPDLDLTITLFNPGGDSDHATLAALAEETMLDVLTLTATTWKAANTEHIDGTAIECAGYATLCVCGKPFAPGGQAADFSRLTIPMAFRGISQRIVASY